MRTGGRSTWGRVLLVAAALAGVAVWLSASGAPSRGELRRLQHGAGWLAPVAARLGALVPFNLLNYAAGIAGLSMRSYLLGTAIGIAPGTVAYPALGSSAGHRDRCRFWFASALSCC